MSLVRPVGYGLLAFPLVVGVTAATYPSTVLLAGLPIGLLVGYVSDGWVAALRNGLVVGVGIATLFVTGGSLAVTTPDVYNPGVGITLFVFALIAVALGVQSALAAGFGGLLNR